MYRFVPSFPSSLWHGSARVTGSPVSTGHVFVFAAHTGQNIAPQIIGIVLGCQFRSSVSENQIRRDGGIVPDSLIDFVLELSSFPGGVSLDKECLLGIHVATTHLGHEFVGSANVDSWADLAGPCDGSIVVESVVIMRINGSSIRDLTVLKGHFQGQINVAGAIQHGFAQSAFLGAEMSKDRGRERKRQAMTNQKTSK